MDRDSKPRTGATAPISIDRRTMMLGAASLPLAAPSLTSAAAIATPFSDAHSHFFNAADLPIAGFAKYDLMPEWLGDNPAVAALIDLLAYFIKPRAKTAAWEANHLGEPEEWGWKEFAREAAHFVLGRTRDAPAKELTAQGVGQAQLKSSYDLLRTALIADANRPLSDNKAFNGGPSDLVVTQKIFEEAAHKVDDPGAWALGDVADYNVAMNSKSLTPDLASVFGVIARGFGWVYLMIKRRETHVKEYLQQNGAAGFAPDLLVNDLVDYDLWVNDCPVLPGSSPVEQVEFWSTLRGTAKSWQQPVDVRTFAGFCPLKLAVQTRGKQHRLFDDFRQLRKDGKIAGFKLYPPMGFRPIGNDKLADSDFDPGGIVRTSALDQWHRVASKEEPLGLALDTALGEFYDHCVAEHVPIMAHSRRSNGTAPNYEDRASPDFWQEVVERWPIRLQLGHLITGAQAFVDSNPGGRDAAWPLESRISMLSNPHFDTGPQVYGDLGYNEDLLGNPALAAKFFVKLREVFGDVGLRRISYGTDWIMLQREKRQREYLSTLVNGMTAACYTQQQKADILENNVRRFLGG